MTRYKSWTLTDVAGDLWIDSFSVSNDAPAPATPHDWSVPQAHPARRAARRRRRRRGPQRRPVVRRAADARHGAVARRLPRPLPRLALAGAGAGPPASSSTSPTTAASAGWPASTSGWCRCGLASNGPPGEDVVTHKDGRTTRTPLTLHGRIANRPAHFVEVRVNLDPPYEISVVGHVAEAGLFLPHLHLTTTTTTVPGSNRVVIHDVVENRAAQPAEMQMLYHVNVGPPFLEAGSRVLAPIREMAPLTTRAAEGIDTYETYLGPTAGYAGTVRGLGRRGIVDHADGGLAGVVGPARAACRWCRNRRQRRDCPGYRR